jgi:hypothetical protein
MQVSCLHSKMKLAFLVSTKKELQILGCQGLHGCVVIVDGRMDHAGLLLLK